jgi:hypothetical protein
MPYKSDLKMANAGIALLRIVGYGLLLLSLIDFIALFIPVRLMDPVWELKTIGALVERAVVPLIGVALVFYREIEDRVKFGFLCLKVISWATTGVGILYFLLPPLLILNTARLSNQLTAQLNTQVEQRSAQLEFLAARLQQVNAEQDLRTLASRLNNPILDAAVQTKTAPEIKQLLLNEVNQAKPRVRKEVEASMAERRFGIFKDTFRLLLGSLIAGILFLWAGYLTQWARQSL